jgi:uncharacterized protein (DUF305 family)
VAALAACTGGAPPQPRGIAAYEAAVRRNRTPVNEADVRFMTGMIPHHAQAVLFAAWAESHDASRAVAALCERIVVAQRDEIRTMRNWLGERDQAVPPGDPATADTRVGMHHHLMAGMLTGEQLTELDAARGPEFDRLFLEYMILHHQGALLMVDELFASYGGAQDDFVYKVASDIYADQSTEIERMQRMLDAISEGGGPP